MLLQSNNKNIKLPANIFAFLWELEGFPPIIEILTHEVHVPQLAD